MYAYYFLLVTFIFAFEAHIHSYQYSSLEQHLIISRKIAEQGGTRGEKK
jgi:hypothetical protein